MRMDGTGEEQANSQTVLAAVVLLPPQLYNFRGSTGRGRSGHALGSLGCGGWVRDSDSLDSVLLVKVSP